MDLYEWLLPYHDTLEEWPPLQKKRFFAQLSGWHTADPADLLVSRQQIEAGRGQWRLYDSAGRLGGVSGIEVAV